MASQKTKQIWVGYLIWGFKKLLQNCHSPPEKNALEEGGCLESRSAQSLPISPSSRPVLWQS